MIIQFSSKEEELEYFKDVKFIRYGELVDIKWLLNEKKISIKDYNTANGCLRYGINPIYNSDFFCVYNCVKQIENIGKEIAKLKKEIKDKEDLLSKIQEQMEKEK